MIPTSLQFTETAAIGLVAGLLGGLAGIGGSMIMLPALHVFYGERDGGQTHHLYMAAAMVVNLIVAIPAARKHKSLGAVRTDLTKVLMPCTAASAVIGVLLGNLVPGETLRLALAAFILAYCVYNVIRMVQGPRPADTPDETVRKWQLIVTGCVTGLIAGVLGLGGGVIMVPMLQVLCRVRLRQAIGTSSATMVITALTGAIVKVLTLSQHGEAVSEALMLAAIMAPGAVVGAIWGASLTHRLPIRAVRAIITALLVGAAWKLAGDQVVGWVRGVKTPGVPARTESEAQSSAVTPSSTPR